MSKMCLKYATPSPLFHGNGLILVNKPSDYTCQDVLSILKGVLKVDKIGHTGTLDKNATGLLVCLLGKSTKYQDYFINNKKVYTGELVLGLSTDTEDIFGKELQYLSIDEILKKYNTKDELYKIIEQTIKSFMGEYKQTPPMYSCKKVNGRTLLSYAKEGKIFDRKVCDVYIHNIELDGNIYEKNILDTNVLAIKIKVSCSKGTYIRTLCKDIGEKLNIPCCMGELNREETDGFNIKDSYTIEDIKSMVENNDKSFIKLALYNKCDQVVTFGKYDCVHVGHREIIKNVIDIAKEKGYESSVLTFSINPKLLLGADENDSDIKSIITNEQRTSYLKLYGIDNILEFPFDENTKDMEGEDFVKNILIDQMKARVIVVGDDCSYGKGGKCKAKDLIETCKNYNVDVKVIDRVKITEVLDERDIKLLKDKKIIVNDEDNYISATLIRKIRDKKEREISHKLIGHDIDRSNI